MEKIKMCIQILREHDLMNSEMADVTPVPSSCELDETMVFDSLPFAPLHQNEVSHL